MSNPESANIDRKLIKKKADQIRSIAQGKGGEIIGDENLELLLQNKPEVIAYDGFEPSGRMHIAQGLIRSINTNKLTSAGVKFKFWVADWFATMNLKLGGDKKAIRKAGELMIHTWRACGMDLTNVEFVWASEEITSRPFEYFTLMLDIATKMNVRRTMKCTSIMGRKDFTDADDEGITSSTVPFEDLASSLMTSQVFYPVMQCADIFFLGVDICSLGMDQRKVNVYALEYCTKSRRRFKPIIVSHPMLMGLDGSDKMSKSNPDSAIFMDDSTQDINRKIKKAYCKPQEITPNPILEYFKHIVCEIETEPVTIPILNFKTKEVTNQEYTTYEKIESDFAKGNIYPNDLKSALKTYLNKYLQPVRDYFANNSEVRKLNADVKRAMAKAAKNKK